MGKQKQKSKINPASATQSQHAEEANQSDTPKPLPITFSCGEGGPAYSWHDEHLNEGIGGSEEQLILLARHLRRRGHHVTVSNRIEEAQSFDVSLAEDSTLPVNYQHHGQEIAPCDLLVGWRHWRLLSERIAHTQALWCFDIPVPLHCPTREEIAAGALEHIDYVVVVNEYQRGIWGAAGIPDEKLTVIPIGIDASDFSDINVERIAGRCVYCSHPGRGLEQLRTMWPQIRRRIPHATLQACWWEPDVFLPANEEIGILPMKRCGNRELAEELFKAELFTYPSTFTPEIAPAATIKAQMAGAVPVVIVQGGMRETVQFGTKTDVPGYVDAVVAALTDTAWQENQRAPMQEWARATYDWDRCTDAWEKLAS